MPRKETETGLQATVVLTIGGAPTTIVTGTDSRMFSDLTFLTDVAARIEKGCDNCQSHNITLCRRTAKGGELVFHELRCKTCGAALKVGVLTEGGFYIKWSDRFDKYVPKEVSDFNQDSPPMRPCV